MSFPDSEVDRARGSLLGLAWGDVFGCPVEGWEPGPIRRLYSETLALGELPDAYPDELWTMSAPNAAYKLIKKIRPLGMHSDDTQQALALLHVAMGAGDAPGRAWDLPAWAAALTDGWRAKAWRDYGRNFELAMHKLLRHAGDTPVETCGSPSMGIGAAMRCGPLGAALRYASNDVFEHAVVSQALVTHATIGAAACCFATAYAVKRFVLGADVEAVRTDIASAVRGVEERLLTGFLSSDQHPHCMSDSLAKVLALPAASTDFKQLRSTVSATAKPYLAKGFTRAHPNQGAVVLGGVHALAMALWPGDATGPRHLLAQIVMQGKDTDTVGAVAGAVLGARFGCAWIRTDRLVDMAKLDVYADAIAQQTCVKEPLAALLEREAMHTQSERVYVKTNVDKYCAPRQPGAPGRQQGRGRRGSGRGRSGGASDARASSEQASPEQAASPQQAASPSVIGKHGVSNEALEPLGERSHVGVGMESETKQAEM